MTFMYQLHFIEVKLRLWFCIICVTMNKGNGRAIMKVMVVIDESECSYRALMWVLDNLKESIKNLPLVIFAAQPPPKCNYVVSSAFGPACICPFSAS